MMITFDDPPDLRALRLCDQWLLIHDLGDKLVNIG